MPSRISTDQVCVRSLLCRQPAAAPGKQRGFAAWPSLLTDHISRTAALYSVLRSAGRLLLPCGGAGRLCDAVHAGHGDRLHQRHRSVQQVPCCQLLHHLLYGTVGSIPGWGSCHSRHGAAARFTILSTTTVNGERCLKCVRLVVRSANVVQVWNSIFTLLLSGVCTIYAGALTRQCVPVLHRRDRGPGQLSDRRAGGGQDRQGDHALQDQRSEQL